jgi:hypothetical protein
MTATIVERNINWCPTDQTSLLSQLSYRLHIDYDAESAPADAISIKIVFINI